MDFYKIGISKNTDNRDPRYKRDEHIVLESTLANCWCVEQYLLAETEFAKPLSLPCDFDNWDGREELRNKRDIDLDFICDSMVNELKLCKEIGWQEYAKRKIIYEKGYIIQKLK